MKNVDTDTKSVDTDMKSVDTEIKIECSLNAGYSLLTDSKRSTVR